MKTHENQDQSILSIPHGISLKEEDGIAVLNFESKANCASTLVLDGLLQALTIAQQSYPAMVISQLSEKFFCVGADLPMLCELIKTNNISAIRNYLSKFQQTSLALRYASIPIVAAVRGYALGGGCELMMHCDQIITTYGSRSGLVEASIGLLPCGAGTKEMILRANGRESKLKQYYLQITQGLMAKDADQAKQFDYLREKDIIITTDNELKPTAIRVAKQLANNYQPPKKPIIPMPDLSKADYMQLYYETEPHYTAHDHDICEQVADIFATDNQQTSLTENELLERELIGFMNLVMSPKTLERIEYTLKTGKHLHN